MSRLDHNRAYGILAHKLGVPVTDIKNVFIFGNHSNTMVPVYSHATAGGKKVTDILKPEEIVELMKIV